MTGNGNGGIVCKIAGATCVLVVIALLTWDFIADVKTGTEYIGLVKSWEIQPQGGSLLGKRPCTILNTSHDITIVVNGVPSPLRKGSRCFLAHRGRILKIEGHKLNYPLSQ